MLSKEQAQAIEVPKRIMLIIFAALILGLVFFAIITLFVRLSGEGPLFNMDFGMMAMIGTAFAAIALLPSIVVPMFVQRGAVKEVAEQFAGKLGDAKAATKMAGGLQSSMIIGLALLQGAAFLNGMAFLIDGSIYNMIVLVALLLCMFVRIPLPGRVEDKIESMLDDAKQV